MSGEAAAPKRALALDAFRGLAILGMLIVNNISLGETTPKTFLHAEFSGAVHFADLVFPWFLLAMGIAAGLASKPASYVRVLRRVVALLVLGMLVDSAVKGELYLGLGVLQLIGLAYGVAALAMRLPVWGRMGLAALLLALHSALVLSHGSVTASSNAIYALNPVLEPFKLRGVLSVMPTGALAILASFVGIWLKRDPRSWQLPAMAAGMTVAGIVLAIWLPMLKPIWTASYVLYCGGLGTLLLFWLSWAELWKGFSVIMWPLLVFGGNAIVAYVGPILLKVLVLQKVKVGSVSLATYAFDWLVSSLGRVEGGLAYLVAYIVFWLAVCAVLARYQLYVRV